MLNVNRSVQDAFYRYKMPRLQAKVEGKGNGVKTVIPNMVDIARALGRPPTCKLSIIFWVFVDFQLKTVFQTLPNSLVVSSVLKPNLITRTIDTSSMVPTRLPNCKTCWIYSFESLCSARLAIIPRRSWRLTTNVGFWVLHARLVVILSLWICVTSWQLSSSRYVFKEKKFAKLNSRFF